MFFKTLGDAHFAEQAKKLAEGKLLPPPVPAAPSPAPVAREKPLRSDALNLLAVLQREGRLIDFLKENITGYNDAQIGAAVRDVHRDCAAALDRILAIRPLRTENEGSPMEVPAGFDANQMRLTGNVAGQPPYRGVLRHAGWQATKVELPEWTGNAASAKVIAPAEVEI